MSYDIGTHVSFTKEPPYVHVKSEFLVGTQFRFDTIAGQVKARLSIPVVFV